jgi:hypothetical protein
MSRSVVSSRAGSKGPTPVSVLRYLFGETLDGLPVKSTPSKRPTIDPMSRMSLIAGTNTKSAPTKGAVRR